MRTYRSYVSGAQLATVDAARKVLVGTVFPALRKQNILARANFLCCQSCAGYALAGQATERNARGYVYWHRQDNESIEGPDGGVYLAYTGADACSTPPPNAETTLAIGQAVVRELARAGLRYEWDGTDDQRIWVDLKAGTGPLTKDEHLALTIGL